MLKTEITLNAESLLPVHAEWGSSSTDYDTGHDKSAGMFNRDHSASLENPRPS